MKTPILCMVGVILINLNACASVSGNVVPPSGPSMENVYDSMGKLQDNPEGTEKNSNREHEDKKDLKPVSLSASGFHKIPNPALPLYIYPHLAGEEQIPVPGYTTVFNAYERDHYALD